MAALATAMIGTGVLLIWSALTGRPVLAVLGLA